MNEYKHVKLITDCMDNQLITHGQYAGEWWYIDHGRCEKMSVTTLKIITRNVIKDIRKCKRK